MVGVLAEILVARRVQQVEGEPLVLEAHHRRGDRDAALALDRHPIGAHPPPLAARPDFARQLDRPAEQQEFLGQGGLAGVRMRNDRKGPPARYLVGQGTHVRFPNVLGRSYSKQTEATVIASEAKQSRAARAQLIEIASSLRSSQ